MPLWSPRAGVTVQETAPASPELLAGLIDRVALRRDRAAFGRLFDHFAPRVKGYMLRLGASAAQAEDLAQDTLLTLWHKADRFDPTRAGAATWVFTIARNLRIDTLRRERLVEPLDELAAAAIAADDMPADSAIAVGQAEAALRRAMAGYAVGRWRPIGRGIALVTVLPAVGGRAGLHLLRIAPGVRLAGHGHGGLELTAVLRGQVRDTVGTYGVGDVAENSEDVDHAPMAVGDQTCVCMIAVGGKLVFRNWLLRLMQPLFGM